MPKIHPSTLFHFTSSINSLKGILSHGLRMSYCYEECTCDLGMALPMICFCDIPLLRTLEHRVKYGNFMVGFDKKYLIDNCQPFLNPVFYLNSLLTRNLGNEFFKTFLKVIDNSFSNEINRLLKDNGYIPLVEKYGFENVLKADENLHYKSEQISLSVGRLRYILAFSKEYSTKKGRKEVINYDEREWRYITAYWSNKENNAVWKSAITPDEFNGRKNDLNATLWTQPCAFLKIKSMDIVQAVKFIVVKKESQIPQIIAHIRKSNQLFGTTGLTKEQRDILISRILSFDTIESNF